MQNLVDTSGCDKPRTLDLSKDSVGIPSGEKWIILGSGEYEIRSSIHCQVGMTTWVDMSHCRMDIRGHGSMVSSDRSIIVNDGNERALAFLNISFVSRRVGGPHDLLRLRMIGCLCVDQGCLVDLRKTFPIVRDLSRESIP